MMPAVRSTGDGRDNHHDDEQPENSQAIVKLKYLLHQARIDHIKGDEKQSEYSKIE